MTQKEFDALPLLLRRKEVIQCGIENKKLDTLTRVLTSPEEVVPFGMIGAVVSKRPDSKREDKHGYKRYRKLDLAKMCGFQV